MLYVHCKGCGRAFETQLQVDPSELLRDQPFNSMEACPHCKAMKFYVRDDFRAAEDSSSNDPSRTEPEGLETTS